MERGCEERRLKHRRPAMTTRRPNESGVFCCAYADLPRVAVRPVECESPAKNLSHTQNVTILLS